MKFKHYVVHDHTIRHAIHIPSDSGPSFSQARRIDSAICLFPELEIQK